MATNTPVDPGPTIHWSRTPSYTHSLLSLLTPTSSIHLFSSSKASRPQRQTILAEITPRVFTSGGDSSREKKQKDSISRRVNQLSTEYKDGVSLLKQDPYNVQTTLYQLRSNHPYWDQLRRLLKDHPEMPRWDEDEDGLKPENEGEERDEERAMQGVHYHSNEDQQQQQAQPYQPVAGPSNHRNQPPFANPNQNPQPLPSVNNQNALTESRDEQKQRMLARIVELRAAREQERLRGLVEADEREARRVEQLVREGEEEYRRDEERRVEQLRRLREREREEVNRRNNHENNDDQRRDSVSRRRSASPPMPMNRQRNEPGTGAADHHHYAEDADGYIYEWIHGRKYRVGIDPRPGDEQIQAQANEYPPPPLPRARTPPPPVVAPAPVAPPPQQHDDDALTSCPKCQFPLLSLTPLESEQHLRDCFDSGGGQGAHLEECPVCETKLTGEGWTREKGEKHVDECCRGLTAAGGGGTGGGTTMGEKRGRRDHVVFVCDEKSIPKDDKTGTALECSFCLDEFSPDTSLARLSCYCIYHEECVKEYWTQPGKFCPLHRDLDGVTEVEMN
ncbi:uncharacterized protein JCM6883_007286 [Sporobolomyces salmoneus]|uniref:uncharacterized protein n=1 Tax=Sporobolomyces salmoneus TaxID=183962 RepID=UPI003176CAD0